MPPLQSSPRFNEREDELDLADIGRSLLREWRQIALITVIATAIALWSVMASRPQFTVSGSLYLGDAQGGVDSAGAIASTGFNFLSDFQNATDVDTQIELIQAKALLEQVILETGLNASLTPAGAQDMLFWRWRFHFNENVNAFAPRPGDLQVLDAVIADQGSRGANFELIFDDAGHYRLMAGGLFGGGAAIVSGSLNQPASGGGVTFLIKSVDGEAVPVKGARYALSIAPAKAVADALLGGPLAISASGATPSNLAEVRMAWGNPFQAVTFVNQLMSDFIATQLSWKTQSASTTEAFVAEQLSKVQKSLDIADANLAAYQSKTGIVNVPANAQAVLSQLSQYEVQRTTILLQKEALHQLDLATSHPATGINPYLVSQTNDPLLGQLAQTLATAEIQLRTQRVQFTENAPEVQATEAGIGKIEDAMRSAIKNDESLATAAMANTDDLIAQYQTKLKAMPAEALQVIALTRSSDVFGQLYVLLMQKEEEAEVSKAATIVNTRIVSPAEVPLGATKPKAKVTVFTGLFLGLFAGIGIVLAQRAFSGKFQSDDEIRRLVPLPVYGLIPRRSKMVSARGIFSNQPQSPFAESFRLLRSNLYQSVSGQQSRIILITSSGSAEGKTTIAANLAKTLADDGKRVVLVDGDLYRGRVHEALRIDQAPGLTEWLVTTRPPGFKQVVDQRFLVLPAGVFPPNPSELLNETVLQDIIVLLRAEFDFIIVDCPPLPAVSDSITLGHHADLILSIVNIGQTSRRTFLLHNEALATLDRRHGIVINGVVGSSYGYGYGYGYGPPGRPSLFNRLGKIFTFMKVR